MLQKIPSLREFCQQHENDEKTTRRFIKSYDPATRQPLKVLGCQSDEIPSMTRQEVEERVKVAREEQKEWKKTTFEERTRVLQKVMDIMLERKHEIAVASCKDTGKTLLEAYLGEIIVSCEKIRFMINRGEHYLSPEKRSLPLMFLYKKAFVEYVPIGVIGIIVPFNYPYHTMLGPILTALFAGNTCIVKGSEWSAWSTIEIFESIFHQALIECGFTPDVVQFAMGFGDVGESVIRAGCDHIFFIGSPQTGRKIMQAAADSLTPVTLELGGKDPFIICDDADMNKVFGYATRSIFINNGQNCIAAERFFVQEKVYDRFVEHVVNEGKHVTMGPTYCTATEDEPIPEDKLFDCGAIVLPGSPARLEADIKEAVKHGAKLLVGGYVVKTELGNYLTPTILADCTPDMKIMQDEVFGPVMLISKWKTDEEVIKAADSTPYGLGCYVFTTNAKRGKKILDGVASGVACINEYGFFYLCVELPFGGVKVSGFGRFNGREGVRAFSNQRSFVVDRFSFLSMDVPSFMRYPVTSVDHRVVANAVELIYSSKGLIHKLKQGLKLVGTLLAASKQKKQLIEKQGQKK